MSINSKRDTPKGFSAQTKPSLTGADPANLVGIIALHKEETMLEKKSNNVAASFFAASLISVVASIGVWVSADGDPAHAERFGIFVGLWAPTLMGLANYYRE